MYGPTPVPVKVSAELAASAALCTTGLQVESPRKNVLLLALPEASLDVLIIPETILLASIVLVVKLFQLSLKVLLVLTVAVTLMLFFVIVKLPEPVAVILSGLIVTPLTLSNASLRSSWILKLLVVTEPTK